jgi:RNA polymerase sigma factor (sigma-70 family)
LSCGAIRDLRSQQIEDYTHDLRANAWRPPFDTPLHMLFYTVFQERATERIYLNLAKIARGENKAPRFADDKDAVLAGAVQSPVISNTQTITKKPLAQAATHPHYDGKLFPETPHMPQTLLQDLFRFLRRAQTEASSGDFTDGALLVRFLAQREEAAFEMLVQRHGPMVLGLCQRVLGDTHAAEDAFQATFLVLARQAAAIRKQASLGSWLYGVAQRIACRARAQAAARRQRERQAALMATTESLDETTWQDLRAVLDEEVGRLPEKYRAPVVLCHLEGKSHEQAARELGWPRRSLTNRLTRGLDVLRKRLVKRGVTVSAGALATALTVKATASPPAALLTLHTVKAATSVAVGQALTAGMLSPRVVMLAQDAVKGMSTSKTKLILVVAACCLIVVGAWAAYSGLSESEPAEQTPPKLAAKPLLQDKPALDVNGDPLPQGAVARLGQDRWLHDGIARFAEFLPDGKTVVTVNAEEEAVRVWEFPSGKEIRRIPLPPVSINYAGYTTRAALTRDGKTIAVCHMDDNQIYIHDIATGKQLAVLKVANVGGLAFSPDGKHLAVATRLQVTALAAEYGPLRIWDWAAEKVVSSFAPGTDRFCYAPDGKSIATWKVPAKSDKADKDRGEVKLWDPVKGVEIRPVGEGSHSAAFSPNAKSLAILTDDAIVLFDPDTGIQTGKLAVPESFDRNSSAGAPHMVFGKDGTKLYVGTYPGIVYEWNVTSGKLLRQYTDDAGAVGGALALSPDESTLIGSGTGPAFFDLRGEEITPLQYRTPPLVAVQFTPDGKHLLARSGGYYPGLPVLRKFDAATGRELGHITVPGTVAASALSPDGKLLACQVRKNRKWTADPKIVLIEIASGQNLETSLELSSLDSARLCFSPDSKVLAITQEGKQRTIELREVSSAKLLHAFPTERAGFPVDTLFGDVLLFSPTGKTFAAYAGKNSLGLWDTTTGKRVGELSLPVIARTEKYSPWQGRHARSLEMTSAAFSSDGRSLALEMSDGTTRVLEVATDQPRHTLGKKRSAPPRKPRQDVRFLDEPGSCLAFSPDGKWLVRGGFDRVVRVWDIQTGRELAVFKGHSDAVTSLAFAPNGRTLASASADGTALIWDMTRVE